MLNLALIGCGAIGSGVLELLGADAERVRVAAIVVPEAATSRAQAVADRFAPYAPVLAQLPTSGVDLVLEAAGHAAISEHVLPALGRGVPCIVVSIGALSEAGLPEALEAAAAAGGTQVQLVSGAIGGIDALAAARIGGLHSVRYTGRKPPLAWKDTPAEAVCDLASLSAPVTFFEGTAREAASRFPKNANVAATVSLAGLGLDRTTVRLIADPSATENIHHVEAHGAFGRFELTMSNLPLEANPKTSALTVYSAVRAVRNRVAPLAV